MTRKARSRVEPVVREIDVIGQLAQKLRVSMKGRVLGSCMIVATFPMVCPLCRVTTTPGEMHRCEVRQP